MLALACLTASAWAVKLRVRGGTHVDARATARAGRLEVRGSLRDDAGRPLEGRLHAKLLEDAAGAPLPIRAPSPCSPTLLGQLHVGRGELLVDTDGSGSFCFALSGAPQSGVVALEFEGDRLFDRSETRLPIDSSRHALVLSFSPEPRQLVLERESHAVWVDTRLEPADEAREPVQLRLVLEREAGAPREVARTAVRAGERAELTVKSRDLGPPGPATLSVEFAGSDSVQPARRSTRVQLTARVALSVVADIPPSDPSDGVEIDVAIGSGLGAVPGGTVEALVGGQSVGAAPVSAGSARVVATFAAPAVGVVPVTLRYLPDAPWWVATEPVVVNVALAPPSPWRRLPWVLAALAVGVWVVLSWWRPGRTERKEPERTSLPPGRPSLDVIEVGPVHSGWRGRVLDAHDGAPISSARIRILSPTFEGDGVRASADSDQDGRFELAPCDRVEGARLVVGARWHATLEKPLPPAGHVVVSLVSRRRAVLGRLVDWANRMGKPWSRPGDPTPAHVASVARARHAEDVGDWAREVERAAYGPEAPDAEAERRIRAQEPGWRAGGESER